VDPYVKVVGRNPGAKCNQSFECQSKYCNKDKNVCEIQPASYEAMQTCQEHTECGVGSFCALASTIVESKK